MINSMHMDYLPEIVEVLNIYLDKFVTFYMNDSGNRGSACDTRINLFHKFFLKAKDNAGNEDNLNFRQATIFTFVNQYWKAVCKGIKMLEGIEAWGVVDRTAEMNVIE